MKKNCFNSNLLRMLIVASMLTVVGCGSDDDETIVNVIPRPEQEREEGPVSTGPSVVVNNKINNKCKITNKNFVVEENNLILNYKVEDADPVIHQHIVYATVNCNQIINADINNDQVVDQGEVEQAVGQPVAVLQEAEGAEYQQSQTVPVAELPADQEDFVLVVYGAEEGVTIPVACNSFTVNQQNVNVDNSDDDTTTRTQPRPLPDDEVIEDPAQPNGDTTPPVNQ